MTPKRRYNTRKQKIQNSKSIQKMTEFIKLELAISRDGLKINGKEYKANIQFDNNEIIICDETKENADWLNDLFDNAQDLKKYIVDYQDKTYELFPESLLTIIIHHLKKEMKGVIDEIEINIPEDSDQEIIQRIKSSLLIINIPNSFTETNEETYLTKPRLEDYSKEDFSISKIIDGEEEYQRFKREIERAKQINPNDSRLLEITDYNHWYTKEKYQQWKMKFSCQEREALKLHHLDNNYALFLSR